LEIGFDLPSEALALFMRPAVRTDGTLSPEQWDPATT
jgi:hypothetical protein